MPRVPGHEDQFLRSPTWITFFWLVTVVPLSVNALCKGVVVADNTAVEKDIPFKKPDVPSGYSGFLAFLSVINERGELIRDFNEKQFRDRLLGSSKQRCVPNVAIYPDVRLTLEEYKEGKVAFAKELENNGKVTRRWILYNPPGTLEAIIPVEKDVGHGEAQYFHPDGGLDYVQTFRAGKREGCYESHFPRGAIQEKACYIHGALHGLATRYFENGTIEFQGTFENGLLNGKKIENFFGGEPKLRAYYKRGNADGIYTETFRDGRPRVTASYVDGIIVGTAKVYFEDGSVSEEYVSGTRQAPGHYHTYFKTGKVKSSVPIIENRYEGSYQEFNESGMAIVTGTYKLGLLEGPYQTLYDTGILKSLTKHVKGREVFYEGYFPHGGLQIRGVYGKNGPLAKIETYDGFGALDTVYSIKNGKIDGDVTKFYRDKSVAMRSQYSDGKPTNPITGFYPNGKKQYVVQLSDDGQVAGGIIFDSTGTKLRHIKRPSEGIVYQSEYYDNGAIKLMAIENADGSEQRYYYLGGDSKNVVVEQVFKKDTGLERLKINRAETIWLCFLQEAEKEYLCGSKDRITGRTDILDNAAVFKAIHEFVVSNAFEKADFNQLVDSSSPTSLFWTSNVGLASNSAARNAKGQRCYNLGFMVHCE